MEVSTDLQGNINQILNTNFNKYKKKDTIIKNLVENYYDLILSNMEKKYSNNINLNSINKSKNKSISNNININDYDLSDNNCNNNSDSKFNFENPMDIIPDYDIPKKIISNEVVNIDDNIRCTANEWAPLNCSQRCVREIDKSNGHFCKIHINYRPYGII